MKNKMISLCKSNICINYSKSHQNYDKLIKSLQKKEVMIVKQLSMKSFIVLLRLHHQD